MPAILVPKPERLLLRCRECTSNIVINTDDFLEHDGRCADCAQAERAVRALAARANRTGVHAVALRHERHGWIVKVPPATDAERAAILRDAEDLVWLMHDRGMLEAAAA